MNDGHSVSHLLGSPVAAGGQGHNYFLRNNPPSGNYSRLDENLMEGGDNNLSSPLGLDAVLQGDNMQFLAEGLQIEPHAAPGPAIVAPSTTEAASGYTGSHPPPQYEVWRGPGNPGDPCDPDYHPSGESSENSASEPVTGGRLNRKEMTETHEPTSDMPKRDMLSYYNDGKLRLRNLDQLLLFLNKISPEKRIFSTKLDSIGYWFLFNRNQHIALYNLLKDKYGIMLNAQVFEAFKSKSSFSKQEIVNILYSQACSSCWKDHKRHFETVVNNCMAGLLDDNLSTIAFKGVPTNVRECVIANAPVKRKSGRGSRSIDNGAQSSSKASRTTSGRVRRARILSGEDNSDDEHERSGLRYRATTPTHPPPGWPESSGQAVVSSPVPQDVSSQQPVSQQQQPVSQQQQPVSQQQQPVSQQQYVPQQQSGPPPPPARHDSDENNSDHDYGAAGGDSWMHGEEWTPDPRESERGAAGAEGLPHRQSVSLGSHEGAAWQVQQQPRDQQGAMHPSSTGPVQYELPELYDEDLRHALFGYVDDIDLQQRRHEEAVQRMHATFSNSLRRRAHEVGVYLQAWDDRKRFLNKDLVDEEQKLAQAIMNREAIQQEIAIIRAEQARISSEQQLRWRAIEATTDELNVGSETLRESQQRHAASVEALRSDRAALEADRTALGADRADLEVARTRAARELELLSRDRNDLDAEKEAFRNRRLMEIAAWEVEYKRKQDLWEVEYKRNQDLWEETLRKKKDAWAASQAETRRALNENVDKQRRFLAIELRGKRSDADREIEEQRAAWAAEKTEQERAVQAMREEAQAALESARTIEARARELAASTEAAEHARKEIESAARGKLQRTIELTKTLEEKINSKEALLKAEMDERTALLDSQIDRNRALQTFLSQREQQLMQYNAAMDTYHLDLQAGIFQSLKRRADQLNISLDSGDDLQNLIGNIPKPPSMDGSSVVRSSTGFMMLTNGATGAAGGGGAPSAAAGGGGAPPAAAGGGSGGGEGGGGGR